MMRRLADRPGLVFALVFAWKVALLIFTAQPVPANDSFFYDGPVVNYLLNGTYANPSLALVLPISGNEVFCAYPPLYQLALFGWMSVFGASALSAMWLHVSLFGIYELIVLAIFRRLRTPGLCVNLAGLFLLAITFHDRPDSLAHVFGMAAVYACVRAWGPLRAEVASLRDTDGTPGMTRHTFTIWTWVCVALIIITLGTSLQIGAIYFLFVWLLILASSWFTKGRLPVGAMAASVLIPMGLVALVYVRFPHLWAGFEEHARLTPSISGFRMPQVASILKVIRTVPGVMAVSLLLSWWLVRIRGKDTADAARFWLLAGASAATALVVTAASLLVVTANMVAIASYVQPLVVGTGLALVMTRAQRPFLPRSYVAAVLGLSFIVSIRAIGMTTWGAVCAKDVSYSKALDRLRDELRTITPGSAVVMSSAYLYETARHDDLLWIHSDWPGKPDYSRGGWERDALMALKPAKLIVTQFDYYRRYEGILEDLKAQPELVEVVIENTARISAPDSIKPMQKVVQHISWAPVVVRLAWR